ncbi:MAG: AbrB/MazE/SpoVT family DNA-binding domain-containing protein [Thermincolia bacterium]
MSSKGQVTVPKSIRDLLNLVEGDRVAFIEENRKIIITKANLTAFRQLQDAISKEADEKGIISYRRTSSNYFYQYHYRDYLLIFIFTHFQESVIISSISMTR